jgi:hypothetical protein
VDNVLITNPTSTSFETAVDAEISFGTGLTVAWSSQPLGNIKMPNINITGDAGAKFKVDATFEIANVGHLTEFTKVSS